MITKSKFSNVKDDFYKKIKHGSIKIKSFPQVLVSAKISKGVPKDCKSMFMHYM